MADKSVPPSQLEEQITTGKRRDQLLKQWGKEAWRYTVASGALAAMLILIVNVITLAVMYTKYSPDGDKITFYMGSCRTAKVLTSSSHLIVNVLSTVLLASSNFSMQCLNSPTRREINIAHAQHKALDIGIPSIRNLFFVSRWKVLTWIVLATSSFPLHMVWNSVVFQSRIIKEFAAVTIFENFTTGAEWSLPPVSSIGGDAYREGYFNIVNELQQQVQDGALETLSVEDCYHEYMEAGHVRNVLWVIDPEDYIPKDPAILDDPSFLNSHSSVLAAYDLTSMAGVEGFCGPKGECGDEDHWSPSEADLGDQGGAPIQVCYTSPASKDCKTSIAPLFLILVIVCVSIKAVCFLLTLHLTKRDTPLCTIGDAIQSFINKPDIHTRYACLASKAEYEIFSRRRSPRWSGRLTFDSSDTWHCRRQRWIAAVDKRQWWIFTLSWASGMTLIAFLVSGKITPRNTTLFSSPIDLSLPNHSHTLPSMLIANMPQLLMSYVYLGLNNIMSTILAMNEWCGYSAESGKPPKGLRVTSPAPGTEQRSTYFLSVPYKWGVPTMIAMTISHWLVSEMIIFGQSEFWTKYLRNSAPRQNMEFLYGHVPEMARAVPVNGAICLILVMVCLLMKFPGGIPLAGCCSASIAAACQPLDLREGFARDLAQKKLKWGVVLRPDETDPAIGHATFTADEVSLLESENIYA
ncbi:uncharacterized protein N7496_012662 [Penicillium cataractarum]|uniref:DUF6536 domain-containing protein n=1 Tax=Penicillium cataractarum TaxID=2100454 RepID=A0A9W9UU08_9EURO|nr:uncharacterized protein N7496_012662 [Penicillium cataractarum]KAJ5355450.1 hypothetical protein N7496_012662 [Penicillium cataractarum]